MYGVSLALAAAVLFGASAPVAKLLLRSFDPLQLAGFLYIGAAVAMVPAVISERARFGRVTVDVRNRARLAGVVVLGGAIAPTMLLVALRMTTAGTVSLLLNFEMVATAVLGAALFDEHLGRSAWLGVAGVVVASAALAGESGRAGWVATLLVGGACLCWGADNLLSAVIDGMTPARSTLWKGAVAGSMNAALGLMQAPLRATGVAVTAAIAVGAVAYGASIALHTAAAQRIGAVRAQGVFASAPFIGAAFSIVLLGERMTTLQGIAAVIFVGAVAMLVAGRHVHLHAHGAAQHLHTHTHDDGHHVHEHPEGVTAAHTHWHQHEPVVHAHRHWPDLHHRHSH